MTTIKRPAIRIIFSNGISLSILETRCQLFFILLQGEGVAYRGRALVELSTTVNESIKQATGPLSNEDVIAAQV